MIPPHAAFLEQLEKEPWSGSFIQVCRWLEARHPDVARIGEELHPQNEYLRLGQMPSTIFAPREIASARQERGRLQLRLYGLGLYGPTGPLPLHLTEEIHERRLLKRDTTLVDFLDMFHHRWLSLFFRAWAQGQPAAGLDRSDDERFSMYISALAGLDTTTPASPHEHDIPVHAHLAASAHLVRHARGPSGLTATLEHYFGVRFRIEEYAFQWLRLESEDLPRLGSPGTPGSLGRNAVLGRSVPDRQSMAMLYAGPLELDVYERFLPGGDWNAQLMEWLRSFMGLELRWKIRLQLHGHAVPSCQLGRTLCLGRTAWLSRRDPSRNLEGRQIWGE